MSTGDHDNATSEIVADRVMNLIHRISGIAVAKMRANPDLVVNRTVAGDTAVELIEAFTEEFHIDMTHYSHDDYFDQEGYWHLAASYGPVLVVAKSLEITDGFTFQVQRLS